MVAVSFSVFKEKILSGEKTQTIRPYSEKRYETIKKIGKLQLYWKQRTKECELLGEAELESIDIIRFYAPENLLDFNGRGYPTGTIFKWNGEQWVPVDEGDFFATIHRDGFETINDMYEWFRKKYKDKLRTMNFMRIRWKAVQKEGGK